MKDDLEAKLIVIQQYKNIVQEYEEKLEYEIRKSNSLSSALRQQI
jgi:hypothetical protein